jgi:hypothetical protein
MRHRRGTDEALKRHRRDTATGVRSVWETCGTAAPQPELVQLVGETGGEVCACGRHTSGGWDPGGLAPGRNGLVCGRSRCAGATPLAVLTCAMLLTRHEWIEIRVTQSESLNPSQSHSPRHTAGGASACPRPKECCYTKGT